MPRIRDTPMVMSPPPWPVRRDGGLYRYERALARAGFALVAGADEAGRGACAGPLVAAAVMLAPSRARAMAELADSKLLTPLARERVYEAVTEHAVAWEVVVVPPDEIDRHGLHRANLAALRRAVARLAPAPSYVLTDGFGVEGTGRPGLAVWKGDQVAACVAAASVVAKVTRDRIMVELHERYPEYGFDVHKGYVTADHQRTLGRFGPCSQHRHSYANVAAAACGETSVAEPVGSTPDVLQNGKRRREARSGPRVEQDVLFDAAGTLSGIRGDARQEDI
jgi:ribonuclease HII